jgi:hypothetical protein
MECIMSKFIEQAVKSKYGAVATSGLSTDHSGVRAVAEAFGYSADQLASIPAEANMGLSCGNPTAFASLREGETVVDLGSGGGLDVFLAAAKVGPKGKAIGIDMTPEMLALARANAAQAGLTAEQVPRLSLKWAFGFPDTTSAWSQPTVVGGRLFVGRPRRFRWKAAEERRQSSERTARRVRRGRSWWRLHRVRGAAGRQQRFQSPGRTGDPEGRTGDAAHQRPVGDRAGGPADADVAGWTRSHVRERPGDVVVKLHPRRLASLGELGWRTLS